MAWVFPILLLAWPAIEIAAFVKVADWIGVFPALAAIVVSSLAGLGLLRLQGIATVRRAQAQLASGQAPVGALFDGACLAVAGLLFLLPGFVTDLFGLALLLPPVRRLLGGGALLRMHGVMVGGRGGPPPPRGPGGPPVIDGEWKVVEDKDEHGNPPANSPPGLPPR